MKLPKRKKAIGCKWVYRKKEALSENKGEKFKAQWLRITHRERNTLDMLTKPVPTNKFKSYLDLVDVCSL